MSLTIVQGKHNISVLMDGSTAFDIKAAPCNLPWVRLCSIQYYAATATNVLTVRDGAADAVQICKMQDVTAAGVHREFHPHQCSPYIVGNEAANGDLVIFEFV